MEAERSDHQLRAQAVKDFDVAASELAAVNDAVAQEIEEAVAFAEASPDPGALDYQRYIYA